MPRTSPCDRPVCSATENRSIAGQAEARRMAAARRLLMGDLPSRRPGISLMTVRLWHLAHGRSLELGRQARLMGILNVTPDSFSDGGRYAEVEAAVAQAFAMVEAGASIIDIGGRSTRPGATEVDASEEQARVLPVISALRRRPKSSSRSTPIALPQPASRSRPVRISSMMSMACNGNLTSPR